MGFFQDDFDLEDPATEIGIRKGGFGTVISGTPAQDAHNQNDKESHLFSSGEAHLAECSSQDAQVRGSESKPQRSQNIKFSEK